MAQTFGRRNWTAALRAAPGNPITCDMEKGVLLTLLGRRFKSNAQEHRKCAHPEYLSPRPRHCDNRCLDLSCARRRRGKRLKVTATESHWKIHRGKTQL